ncbi:proline--tRNA ligase [bacterium]|nr:proline--tRNA ligase [bacterium]
MRWSQLFIPTLKEAPAQVEAPSHKYLLRAGYIRQLTSGVYSLLPLGQLVRLKIVEIIRQEMNKIGGQEFLLSALQPVDLWIESGRLEAVSEIMFRLKDRKKADLALGLTHEEVFTSIARSSLSSYKQLPQIWYQIQTKFRDEARPKGGLLRVREFTMKDSYSFDFDQAGLDASFDKHHEAYVSIFKRCGLDFRAVEASSGAMGGSASIEFMVLTNSGEDNLVLCTSCDYAANVERGSSKFEAPASNNDSANKELEKFATPQIRTIKALEDMSGGASAQNQIKTLVYLADSKIVLALVQGDQEMNESKLQTAIGASTIRPATDDEIFKALNAHPGSLGACGVKPNETIKNIVADPRLKGRCGMVTGANNDDWHYRNVSVDRDIEVNIWTDLHTVKAGEACIKCGGTLDLQKGLEIGHIFKLGTKYSKSMNAHVLGADGAKNEIVMGSYGIGVERLMAAVVETSHDDKGIIWPQSITPYDVVIVPVNSQDEALTSVSEKMEAELTACGISCLLDDRDERAGVKFNDAELIGIPWRITAGKKVSSGLVELFDRKSKTTTEIAIEKVREVLQEKLSCKP